jgi:hypothetical protein
VVVALLLRTVNLDYSEFQGDEALAMISAAEALEGHEDALFLRSKGPGEVLLPMALWRLTGTITEDIARLPFALASLLSIVTIFLIGRSMEDSRVGWLAAGFFAVNGFMVAFGRIVQYQALVIWLSALAFLLAVRWQQKQQLRLLVLSGLFLGTGLLAHYDAILVLPAVIWLILSGSIGPSRWRFRLAGEGETTPPHVSTGTPGKRVVAFLTSLAAFSGALLLVALPFYIPFGLDPQANRTGAYVGSRIGNQLRNNLPDFFHFSTFYSSSYYVIITGLLVLGLLAWLLWRARWSHWLVALLAVVGILAITVGPPPGSGWDQLSGLAIVPFALTLLGAFLAFPFKSSGQAVIIWLAVPFLGYNFVVALGLTHVYTTVPAWSLLAALGWYHLVMKNEWFSWRPYHLPLTNLLLAVLFLLATVFLWNAFVRHDPEYWQDYPAGNLAIFWDPYDKPPAAGFFGFAHRTGWKAIGQKMTTGALAGDYGSNEEPDVTAWYTRGAPRACDLQPEYYLLADDLIDPFVIPDDLIDSDYANIGGVTLANQKQLRIMQLTPTTDDMGELNEVELSLAFDRSATPGAFARSARGSQPSDANFGNVIRLIGYDLDTRRAYPGGRVPVTLYWQTLTPIQASYQVFVHLEGSRGLVAQADGVPVCWSYPTDLWRPGQIIADQHAITIPNNTLPGNYALEIGLYHPDTLQRLDLLDAAANPAGTSLLLAAVRIRDPYVELGNEFIRSEDPD